MGKRIHLDRLGAHQVTELLLCIECLSCAATSMRTGNSALWFNELNAVAASKVAIALTRIAERNFSNAKSAGAGVYEYRIDFGPGYRIYFGRDGDRIIVLIRGGTKKRQQHDITAAQECWADYKRRRKQEYS
jgi:putative addiction module killer protein